jgi:hypothetical protein
VALERQRQISQQNKFLLKSLFEAESHIKKQQLATTTVQSSALNTARSGVVRTSQLNSCFQASSPMSQTSQGFHHAMLNKQRFLMKVDDENARIYSRLKEQ